MSLGSNPPTSKQLVGPSGLVSPAWSSDGHELSAVIQGATCRTKTGPSLGKLQGFGIPSEEPGEGQTSTLDTAHSIHSGLLHKPKQKNKLLEGRGEVVFSAEI